MKDLKAKTERIEEWMIELRRDFHRHPELGGNEKKTSERIARELKKLGIEYREKVGGYGIVAYLKGKKPGAVVGLRADMDALPIEEKTGLPFASEVKGRMHACGHDGHTAILLGAASVLKEYQDNFAGEIRLFFQPAEEGPGGAEPMIKDGCMDNPKVQAVFALHLYSNLKTGMVGIKSGPTMAASDWFNLKLMGPGGHAAAPFETVDIVTLAAHLILTFNSMVSREFDAVEPVVVSIGSIHGGEKENVVPKLIEMQGTVRTLEEKIRLKVKKRMENLVRDYCRTWGAEYSLDYHLGYPVTVNDPDLALFARHQLSELLGKSKVEVVEKARMGAEDFAYFARKAPGVMIKLGGGFQDKPNHPHHCPEYDFDEKALGVGVMSLSQLALAYLSK